MLLLLPLETASTSGRQHSAAAVPYCRNAVHTVAASRRAAHSSAAAVPQRDYTSTAVLPVLKDKKWFRNNNKADVSEFDATHMSKQDQVLVRCRCEIRTLDCSLVLALCLNAFLPQQDQVLYCNATSLPSARQTAQVEFEQVTERNSSKRNGGHLAQGANITPLWTVW